MSDVERRSTGQGETLATVAGVGACVACCAPLLIAAPPLAVLGGVAVAGGLAARAVGRRRRRRSADRPEASLGER